MSDGNRGGSMKQGPSKPLRVVICWGGISGYLAACWRALAACEGIDLHLVLFPSVMATDAPFDRKILSGLPADVLGPEYLDDARHVARIVTAHRPDVVVIPGWYIPAFR